MVYYPNKIYLNIYNNISSFNHGFPIVIPNLFSFAWDITSYQYFPPVELKLRQRLADGWMIPSCA